MQISTSRITSVVAAAALGMALCQPASSAQKSSTGTVASLTVPSSVHPPKNASLPFTWLAITNVTSIGSCKMYTPIPGYVQPFVVLDVQDNTGQPMYAMLLAAQLAGSTVTVVVDDTVVDGNGYCIVEAVQAGPGVP